MTGASGNPAEGFVAGFLVPVLAVWRLSHLLWAEDGPWRLVARARRFATAHGARFVDCFYCLSLWVALPVAVLVAPSVVAGMLDWLAFSGAAILLERATAFAAGPATVAHWEELPDQADE